jgi:hypothetical protein
MLSMAVLMLHYDIIVLTVSNEQEAIMFSSELQFLAVHECRHGEEN